MIPGKRWGHVSLIYENNVFYIKKMYLFGGSSINQEDK
jgi:hypothetical protein